MARDYSAQPKGLDWPEIFPQDSLAAATNPAGMVFVGDRFDFGLTWFRPIRGASITGSGVPGVDGIYDGRRKKNFFIPELGYTHLINPKLALGVSIYGNGGMNTAYTTPFPLFSGPTNFRAGVDLQQLFVSPTVAFKANAHSAFGVALNIAYQKFSAQGLENFANSRASGIQLCSTTWWSAEERRFSAISRWEAWQSRQSPHPCHDR